MEAAARRAPGLTDVPETMLWTLHSRASEALRPDGVLDDPRAIDIHRAIDYDYERSFGRANPLLALRAARFDDLLRAFLRVSPTAAIVNLGEGLETQRYRVDAPEALWIAVDLPEAIAIRERYIEADSRHLHIAQSATELSWLDAVPAGRPLYVSAQGLFMYLPAQDVRALLQGLYRQRQPDALVFDVIPAWMARLSRAGGGLPRTPRYRIPTMPWGVDRHRVPATVRRWLGADVRVDVHDLPPLPWGRGRVLSKLAVRSTAMRLFGPSIVELCGLREAEPT